MEIFVDVDGVLVNFLKQYTKFYYKETGVLVNWRKIIHYDLSQNFKIEKYKYLYDRLFYNNIEFMPNSIKYINLLHKNGYKIYFSTACVTYESMIGKFELLRKTFKFFSIENFIVLGCKNYLYTKNGILIDDSPYTFEKSVMPAKICYSWLYNRNVKNVDLKTNNWHTIYTYILDKL